MLIFDNAKSRSLALEDMTFARKVKTRLLTLVEPRRRRDCNDGLDDLDDGCN